METSNTVDSEHLRKACLRREVADYDGALAMLQNANEGEAELVLLAVRAAKAFASADSDGLRETLDALDKKNKEIKAAPIPTMLVFRSICEIGRARLAIGEAELAGQMFRTALGLAQDEYGKTSLESIYPSICLAIYHESQGSNLLAAALAREALMLLRDRRGQIDDQALMLAAYIVIGRAAVKERRFQQSLSAAEDALTLAGKHSLPLGNCERLQECAVIKMQSLAQLDRLQDAKDQGEVLIEAIENVHGHHSPLLLEPLCQLASIYERTGGRAKASKCLDQALSIVSNIVEQTPFTPTEAGDKKAATMPFKEYEVLNRLAETYYMQGKFVDGLKLYPASMRARYTTYVASTTNIIDMLSKHIAQFSEDHQRKQSEKNK